MKTDPASKVAATSARSKSLLQSRQATRANSNRPSTPLRPMESMINGAAAKAPHWFVSLTYVHAAHQTAAGTQQTHRNAVRALVSTCSSHKSQVTIEVSSSVLVT